MKILVRKAVPAKWNTSLLTFCLLLCIGCAHVPKESVELSATVGRDIAQVYRAHRELAVVLYERIKSDINRFIDEVYAPYQIQKLLQADQSSVTAHFLQMRPRQTLCFPPWTRLSKSRIT